MSLVNILNEIEKSRPQAETVVNSEPASTYGGRLGLKKAALETIKRLRSQYLDELMTSTAFIVVTGSAKEAFSDLASSDSFGCFSEDPEALYKELADKVSPPSIRPSLYGREGVRSLFSIAQNVLRDKATDLDITSYPALYFNDKYNRGINTAEEFADLLKTAINDQVGSEIVGINAVHSIVEKAISKGHSSPVTPVLFSTNDEKFALDLVNNLTKLKTKTFLVVAGKASKELAKSKNVLVVKNVSEETVGETLSSIRNQIL